MIFINEMEEVLYYLCHFFFLVTVALSLLMLHFFYRLKGKPNLSLVQRIVKEISLKKLYKKYGRSLMPKLRCLASLRSSQRRVGKCHIQIHN